MSQHSISRRRLLEVLGAGAAVPSSSAVTDSEELSYRAYSPGGGEYPDRLVVEGNDLVTKYKFTATEGVNEGETTDLSDLSYRNDVLGFIGDGGVDDNWFSGDISRFDDDAELDPFEPGTIDRWELLSGDPTDPDVHEVPMDRPLVIATGDC